VRTGSRPARRVERALRSVLPASTDVRVIPRDGATVGVRVAGHRFRAQWLGTGFPSEIRSILQSPGPHPDVLVARQLSPGAREILSQHGIGWVDELGAAEIALGTLIVSRTGRAPRPSKKPGRWTPAVLGVAEALLCDTQATVAAMQEMTGLSAGSCTYALRVLADLGFLQSHAPRGRRSGRRLTNRDKLLETYASQIAAIEPRASLVVGVTWRDPIGGLAELGRRWTHAGLDWAATGLVAAAVLAPLVTALGSAIVYVGAETSGELAALAARFDLRPIEGGRLTLVPFPTTSTRRLTQTVADLRVAPWPRVYADLRTIGVRGEEAAEHLREVIDGR
jgi:hypothetical protein